MSDLASAPDQQPAAEPGSTRAAALLGAVYQGAVAVLQLASLAVLARSVPRDILGQWMVVLALASWAPLTYLGQPQALMTRLGSIAQSDPTGGRGLSASATLITSACAGLVLLALLGAAPWLSGAALVRGASASGDAVARVTVVATLAAAVLSNPATISNFVLLAHRRGVVVHLVMLGSSVLCTVIFAALLLSGAGITLAGPFMLCGPLLGGLVLWRVLARAWPAALPRRAELDRATGVRMLRLGLHFMAVELVSLSIVRTPDLIVARLHGPESVALFSAVGRAPLLVLAVVQTILLPYWPVLGEAMLRNDAKQAWRIVRTSGALVGLVCVAGILGLQGLGRPLIVAWVGFDDASLPLLIGGVCLQCAGFGVLAWLTVMFSALAMFRHQITVFALSSAAYLVLAWTLGREAAPAVVSMVQGATLVLLTLPAGCWLVARRLRALRAPAT